MAEEDNSFTHSSLAQLSDGNDIPPFYPSQIEQTASWLILSHNSMRKLEKAIMAPFCIQEQRQDPPTSLMSSYAHSQWRPTGPSSFSPELVSTLLRDFFSKFLCWPLESCWISFCPCVGKRQRGNRNFRVSCTCQREDTNLRGPHRALVLCQSLEHCLVVPLQSESPPFCKEFSLPIGKNESQMSLRDDSYFVFSNIRSVTVAAANNKRNPLSLHRPDDFAKKVRDILKALFVL